MKKLVKLLLVQVIILQTLTVHAQFFEDFEQGTKNFYGMGPDTLETGEWIFNNALIGNTPGDKKNGLKSARIQNGYIEMNFDYPGGLSEVSFFAANFSNDSNGAVQVSYSSNGGETWLPLGTSVSLTSTLTKYGIFENIEGNIRLRFARSAGNRINVDDVFIADYIELSEQPRLLARVNRDFMAPGSTFDFGLNTGIATATLQIRNGGEEDLVISSHEIAGEGFSLDGEMDVTLSSLGTASYTLIYESTTPGINTGSITINSNDPQNSQFTIYFTAETLDTNAPVPIIEARQLPQGTTVTVAGWVTVASQFAGPVYFQDETGGIAWYNGAIMRDEWLVGAVIGDSILVTGEMGNFNNLLQIVNDTDFEVFPESNVQQEPLDITLEDLNSGAYESWLVRISNLEFEATGTTFSGNANYTVTDPTAEGQVRISEFTNIPGTNIPNTITEITGVAGRFQNMHQLLPRFTGDIKILSGPIIISTPPYEVSSTASSITFQWETEKAGHSEIRYGVTSDFEMGAVVDEEHKTQHNITLSDLLPATLYKVQFRSAFDADTSATSVYLTSTGSPPGTTGEILTFFNKDVAHELATYREADENINFADKLIQYIQTAEETAEFAFYSISGGVGSNIANEIIDAHNRGVDVRVIASGHTGNVNPVITELANAGVKAVQSTSSGQMHNKFAVFDAHHSDPSKTWVITSSWNATDQGTYDQFQNMVIIQDVALARAYWYEFNQMWGAESGSFQAGNALFGPDKAIANPSVFWIGEDQARVEVYFSPQANTESHIMRALGSSQSTIDLGLNLITRRTLSNTMLDRFNEGVKVRGVIGDVGPNSQFSYLSTWADVHHFSQAAFGLLHHKYGIVDGEVTGHNSKVITGSHNWSANANFTNDENTLIIHHPRVANEYFQEFAARYWQAGGEEQFEVSTSIDEIKNETPEGKLFFRTYPNPFRSYTNIQFELDKAIGVTVEIYDLTGRRIKSIIENHPFEPGLHTIVFDGSALAGGMYICHLRLGDGTSQSKLISVV
ncbi:MAG: T9SS C-terminal target domain-containing protein, partial [Bacteroidetes bacterium]